MVYYYASAKIRFEDMDVAEYYSELRSLVPVFFNGSDNVINSDFQFNDLTNYQKKGLIRVLSTFLDPLSLTSKIEESPDGVYGALNDAVKVAQLIMDDQPGLFSLATEFRVQAYQTMRRQQRWGRVAKVGVPVFWLLLFGIALTSFVRLMDATFKPGVDHSAQMLTAEKCAALKTERTFRGNFALTSLVGCKLDGLELGHSSWAQSKADTNTSFRKVSAAYADFTQITMPRVPFTGANLEGTNLTLANVSQADFSLANLGFARLDGADFSGSKMPETDLERSSIEGTSFSGATLSGANFQGSIIGNTDFSGANLAGATFSSQLGKFSNITELINTSFKGANLIGATFDQTEMKNVDFSDANLTNVRLSCEQLRNIQINNRTVITIPSDCKERPTMVP